MKKLLLVICLLSLTGCQQPGLGGGGKIKASSPDIISYKVIAKGACMDSSCAKTAKVDTVSYTYKATSSPKIYKGLTELFDRRTTSTETYQIDANTFIKKQYLSQEYYKENGVSKEIVSATTTKALWDADASLGGMLGGTDTGSGNGGDNWITSSAPTTNYGSDNAPQIYGKSGDNARFLIKFTLSSGSGTVTAVKLFLYEVVSNGWATATTIETHSVTQTGWTEAGSTWNKYDGTNNWSTAGGDYSATVISSITNNTTPAQWDNWPLMGAGATNPLTLTWGDSVNLLLKVNPESTAGYTGGQFNAREAASNKPYIEITYTEGGLEEVFIEPIINIIE